MVSSVIELRPATEGESAAWLDDWRARLHAWYSDPCVPAAWVTAQVERQLARRAAGQPSATFALVADSAEVGMLATGVVRQGGAWWGLISDVRIAPELRRRGYGAAAVRAAEGWAREHGATAMHAVTNPADPAHAALLARYPVRAHELIRELSVVSPLADGLEGRPMTPAEFAGWRSDAVRGYAADMADSGMLPPDDAAAAAAAQFDQLLPDGLATKDHSFLSLCADGEVVATNWIGHRYAPSTSWVYGVEVQEGFRGRGYGRAAMIIGEKATVAAGDTHLGLNVFGHNAPAIGLYQSMGYRGYDDARSIEL
jgi:GNAT superfamily N-acetyltransferase